MVRHACKSHSYLFLSILLLQVCNVVTAGISIAPGGLLQAALQVTPIRLQARYLRTGQGVRLSAGWGPGDHPSLAFPSFPSHGMLDAPTKLQDMQFIHSAEVVNG
jgi:hypothetical protein